MTSMDVATRSEGGLQVKSSEIQAEVQAAAVLAMQRPRDELASWERIATSCGRPLFADGAEYEYERGHSVVRGPSVKLAREMARCWGNIRYGIRVVSMTEEEVQIEGWAWDLQTNNRVSSEARFGRKVQRRQGQETVWVAADERNLRELINKHGAIAVRNALLQLLPPDMVESAVRMCRRTVAGAAQEKLNNDRDGTMARVTSAWRRHGVTPEMLEKKLDKPLDNFTGEDVATLRSWYQSVADGNSDPSEYFDLAMERAKDAAAELEGAGAKPAPKKKAAKKKAAPDAD